MTDQLTTVRVCEQILGVTMRRKGRSYQGCCPLHNERTPSFTVFPDGACRCYGCGAYFSGPQFLLLAKKFGDKKTYSAQEWREVDDAFARVGVTTTSIPARPQHQVKIPSLAARRALKPILEWCHQELLHGPDARSQKYLLQERGIAPDDLRHFGYCPASASRQLALQKLCDPTLLFEAGFMNTRGSFIHRGRLILMDMGDDVRFYQSRALTKEQHPKYLHARHWTPPATLLEGDSEEIHVVEGFLDGLTLHRLGMTALVTWSATHVSRVEPFLRRFVLENRPIALWQDPGEAGEKFVSRLVPLVTDGTFRLITPAMDPNALWNKHPEILYDFVYERTPYAIA